MAVTISGDQDSTKLGCGRDLDNVWANIDRPADQHETDCSDCQAARSNLSDLHTATQQMISADVADPELRTDPAVLDNIIAVARSEVRRGAKIPLRRPAEGQPAGELTISEQTVAAVIRRVADTTPEVEARRCYVEEVGMAASSAERSSAEQLAADQEPAPTPGGTATRIRVRLSLAVAPHVQIAEVVNALRNKIIAAVTDEIGVEVSVVDVIVEDLLTTDDAPTSGLGPTNV